MCRISTKKRSRRKLLQLRKVIRQADLLNCFMKMLSTVKDKNILLELPPVHTGFKKDKSKYCHLYCNYGRGIKDSFELKEDIETLI